jgi:hypothetical protein
MKLLTYPKLSSCEGVYAPVRFLPMSVIKVVFKVRMLVEFRYISTRTRLHTSASRNTLDERNDLKPAHAY